MYKTRIQRFNGDLRQDSIFPPLPKRFGPAHRHMHAPMPAIARMPIEFENPLNPILRHNTSDLPLLDALSRKHAQFSRAHDKINAKNRQHHALQGKFSPVVHDIPAVRIPNHGILMDPILPKQSMLKKHEFQTKLIKPFLP